MSYAISAPLQAAIYAHLLADPAVTALVGDAVYDTLPSGVRPPLYITLGTEDVRDRSDGSGDGALHSLRIAVVADGAGFARAKDVAGAVSDSLHNADLTLDRGSLVYLRFDKARAARVRAADMRRIDMVFVARVCGAPAT